MMDKCRKCGAAVPEKEIKWHYRRCKHTGPWAIPEDKDECRKCGQYVLFSLSAWPGVEGESSSLRSIAGTGGRELASQFSNERTSRCVLSACGVSAAAHKRGCWMGRGARPIRPTSPPIPLIGKNYWLEPLLALQFPTRRRMRKLCKLNLTIHLEAIYFLHRDIRHCIR